jgi:spore germination protein
MKMIPDDDKISTIQVGVFVFNTILGVGILTLPSSMAEAVGSDAWFVTIISGLVNIIFIYLMCKVGEKYSEYGLVGTLKKLFGGFLGTLLAIPAFVYFLVFCGVVIRIFGETIKLYLLNNTPLEFILLPLILLGLLLARSGVEPVARFFEAVTPMQVFVLIILMLLAVTNADFTNVRPFFTNSPVEYIKSLKGGVFAFSGFEVLLVLFPFIRKPKKAFKASSIALLSLTLIYTIVIIENLAKFGSKQTANYIYPTLTMIQASEIPGGFIQRLEGVLMGVWVVFVFTTLVALIYSFSVIGGDILKQNGRKHIIPLFLPIIYIVALTGESIVDMFKFGDTLTTYLGTYTVVVLPLLMFIMSRLRKR